MIVAYSLYRYRLKGDNMKEVMQALPQMLFLAVLLVNLVGALMDSNRNFKASIVATIVLLTLTYWGGFFIPLLNFLK